MCEQLYDRVNKYLRLVEGVSAFGHDIFWVSTFQLLNTLGRIRRLSKNFENMWNFQEREELPQNISRNRTENEVEVDVETFDEHEPNLAPKVISGESYQG